MCTLSKKTVIDDHFTESTKWARVLISSVDKLCYVKIIEEYQQTVVKFHFQHGI